MIPLMKASRARGENHMLHKWIPIIVMALLVTTAVQMLARTRLSDSLQSEINQLGLAKAQPDTLVVYIFSYTNTEYKENLLHFVRHGIREDDGCQYVIVIQTEDGAAEVCWVGGAWYDAHKCAPTFTHPFSPTKQKAPRSMTLPQVPSNVLYEFHPNGCYDWGTIGWVLENGKINWRKYKYFIFMNSSVRGPYLPPAMQGLISWQELLLNKLAGNVKLVGATISCEGSPFEGNIAGEWRTNPHVQSYVIATDQVGVYGWSICACLIWRTNTHTNHTGGIEGMVERWQGVQVLSKVRVHTCVLAYIVQASPFYNKTTPTQNTACGTLYGTQSWVQA